MPINYRWRRDELAYVLQDAEPGVLVVDAAFLGEAEPALAAAGQPPRERVLVRGDAAGWACLATAIADVPETAPAGALAQSGYNIVIYTSGTTGRPKGVMHPSLDPQIGFEAQKGLVQMWGFRPDDVHLMVGPAYHTMPSAYVAQHLFVGASAVLMTKFDAEECLRLDRDRARDDDGHGPGALRAHPRAAGGGARPLRPVEPPPRPARRGAVPTRRQATHHGGLPAGQRVGVLRRDGRARARSSRPTNGCGSPAASDAPGRASR